MMSRHLPFEALTKNKSEAVVDLVKYGDGFDYTQKLKRHNGTWDMPSSHYSIAYGLYYEPDARGNTKIYFQLSIPKYLYGHNIAQFLPDIDSTHFDYGLDSDFNEVLKKSPKLLRQFLRHFFNNEFAGIHINEKQVEIIRLDFCYNEIHDSKEDALLKLEMQKKHYYKGSKVNKMHAYDTSFSWKTSSKYAKIYHKGEEYKKHDLRHHLQANEAAYKFKRQAASYNTKIKTFDINLLQSIADKTLRYELSFKSKDISIIFSNKVFRSRCADHAAIKKDYKRINSVTKGMSLKVRKIKYKKFAMDSDSATLLAKEKYKAYLKSSNTYWSDSDYEQYKKDLIAGYIWERTCTPDDEYKYKTFRKLLDKSFSFRFNYSQKANEYFKNTPKPFSIWRYNDKAPLNDDIIKELGGQLRRFIDSFEVLELPDTEQLKLSVEAYNEDKAFLRVQEGYNEKYMNAKQKLDLRKKYRKIDYNKMLGFLNTIKESSISDVKQSNIYTKSTFYDYLRDYRLIGYSENNFSNKRLVKNPDVDFSSYYDVVMFQPNFLLDTGKRML